MPDVISELSIVLITGLPVRAKSRVSKWIIGEQTGANTVLGEHGAHDHALGSELGYYLADLARDGKRGRVVIELEASAAPADIALDLESCLTDSEEPVAVRELITVVRASDIREHLFRDDPAAEVDFFLAELLAQQLEFASTIVFADSADLETQPFLEVRALVHRMNPLARLVSLEGFTSTPLTTRAGMRKPVAILASNMGWMRELNGRGPLPVKCDSIDAFTFTDPRPFHPGRLSNAVERSFGCEEGSRILRSRGLVTIASRAGRIGSWATSGDSFSLQESGMTSDDPESTIGCELVFFGQNLDHRQLLDSLAGCLITSAELDAGPAAWARWDDLFPAWPEPE